MTIDESLGGFDSKLASTSKYLEAVFLTRWSNPTAIMKRVNKKCRNQFRSTPPPPPETSIYAFLPNFFSFFLGFLIHHITSHQFTTTIPPQIPLIINIYIYIYIYF
ncbi:hypothetical protein ACB098_01G093000 [Castanea mollissima]